VRRPAGGPNQRLRQAWLSQQRAQASGDPLQIQDAAIRLQQAQDALDRAQRRMQPRTFASRLDSLISTSRLGIGPNGMQLMPLIGRLGALAGSGAGGPAGLALGVATGALTKFTQQLREASSSLGGLSAAATITGGTGQQAAFLRSMGVDPAQQGSFAASLRQRIATDP
jgi:hypothetical protein